LIAAADLHSRRCSSVLAQHQRRTSSAVGGFVMLRRLSMKKTKNEYIA